MGLYLPKNHRHGLLSTDFGRFGGKIVDTRFGRPVSYGFETRIELGNFTETDAGYLHPRLADDA